MARILRSASWRSGGGQFKGEPPACPRADQDTSRACGVRPLVRVPQSSWRSRETLMVEPRRPAASAVSKNRDKHGRGRIPDNIERKEEVHDLSDAEKAALGGAENLIELPSERSEQLAWRPSTLGVTST